LLDFFGRQTQSFGLNLDLNRLELGEDVHRRLAELG
jgi:hypothetical protein